MAYGPRVPEDAILDLALVGSRARGFNHDAASKLQRLMMATSEAEELAGPEASADHRMAIESLHSALAELEVLFAEFRTLAKGSEPAELDVAVVLARAARRANVVLALDVSPGLKAIGREPELVQVLSHMFDVIGGTQPTRAIRLRGLREAGRAVLKLDAGDSESSEALALVAHVVTGTGGSAGRDGTTILIAL